MISEHIVIDNDIVYDKLWNITNSIIKIFDGWYYQIPDVFGRRYFGLSFLQASPNKIDLFIEWYT